METTICKHFKSKLIFGKYSIKFLISKSTFSEVYLGINVLNGKNYALKIGQNENENTILKNETYTLLNLKGPGIPSVVSFGISGKYNILVENLLGKSIHDIWFEKNKKFNLKDTCVFAIQAISLLEYVHSKNYLHRDIKPANFLVGNPDNSQLYLIDFGNASKFRSSRTGKHMRNAKSSSVFGSLLFLSINAFKGIVQTRKDDLESLGLVIIYLYNGSLPWSEIRSSNIHQSYDKVETIRKIVSNDYICRGMPQEMNIYMNYINNLKYDERPDYEYLRQLFLNVLKKIGCSNEQQFSWANKNRIKSSKKSASKSKSKNAKIICQDLLEKYSKKVNNYPSMKNLQLNNNEQQIIHNKYYSETLDFIGTKNIFVASNKTTKGKNKKIIINNKDTKIKKIDYVNEKIKNNNNINIDEKPSKNRLIINPKKINYEKIYDISDNNRNKTRKFIKDNNYIKIYDESITKYIFKNKFKSHTNLAKTHGNSINNVNEIRNYINIENLNINNNSNIYTGRTYINNNESKKLDDIERNNIKHIKTTSSNLIYTKSYKPIYYKLFSSYINARKNNSFLYNNKNNQKVENSFQLESKPKNIKINKNLNSFLIQNFPNSNTNHIHKSKLYKSKCLKNNGLTKILVSNSNVNIS